METGIRLTDLDGGTETYRTQSTYFVKGVYNDTAASGSEYLLMKGIYLVEQFDFENGSPVSGSRSTHAFPLKPADAPLPVDGARWDTEVLSLSGGEVLSERESYIFGPLTEITLGGCSYDMNPIITIYHDEDGYEEKLHYLPELGFAYLVEIKERNKPADRFTYTRIESVQN
ncbi:hypothetical protein [Shimia sp.]|uniref:hypothetical protein n=1 Tax=Shimia sp. TaxID=1954381 RepID=UPI003297E156